MSIVNFKTEDGKTYKKIVRLTGFNIGGAEYQCTTALRMRGATIETPIYSSASMRVIIRAAFPSGATGYLFGDSRFNIRVEGNSLIFLHDGTISTTQNIESNKVYEFGFMNGIPFFQGELEQYTSTSTTGSEKCLIGGAVGKTPITDLILYRIDVYGHYDTTSGKKEAYAYYPCKQGNTTYMVEKWSNSLVTITGTASIYDPNEEEVAYGIELNEVRSLIGSGRTQLVSMVFEDANRNNDNIVYPTDSAAKDGDSLGSAFSLKNVPLPDGATSSIQFADNNFYKGGMLLQGRKPKWNIWADNINIGKRIISNADDNLKDTIQVIKGEDVHIGETWTLWKNQKGHITINPLHEDDEMVHLEDFENYCHQLYDIPTIYRDGVPLESFKYFTGTEWKYDILRTLYQCGLAVGGKGMELKQETNVVFSYPIFGTNGAKNSLAALAYPAEEYDIVFRDEYWKSKDNNLYFNSYYVTFSNGQYTFTKASYITNKQNYNGDEFGVTIDDVDPKYAKTQTEEGILEDVTRVEPYRIITTTKTNTLHGDSTIDDSYARNPIKVDLIKYVSPGGYDISYKIGNLVSWHLPSTYNKDIKGHYCAFRSCETHTVDNVEYSGIPLLFGYQYDNDNVLGSNMSAEKIAQMKQVTKLEDVQEELPEAFRQFMVRVNNFSSYFPCYVDIGLLDSDFKPDENFSEKLRDLSDYSYTARRLFKDKSTNICYTSDNSTQVIIKGLDNTFKLNGINYTIRLMAYRNYDEPNSIPDARVLHQNKSVSLWVCAINEASGEPATRIRVKANLTVYREERTAAELSYEIGLSTVYKSNAVESISLSYSKNESARPSDSTYTPSDYKGFTTLYPARSSPRDAIDSDYTVANYPYYELFDANGNSLGKPQKTVNGVKEDIHFFATVWNDRYNYFPILCWQAEKFKSSVGITENVNASDYATETVAFKENCSFLIEIIGVEEI